MIDFRVPVDPTETPRHTAERLVATRSCQDDAGRRGAGCSARAEERARYARQPLHGGESDGGAARRSARCSSAQATPPHPAGGRRCCRRRCCCAGGRAWSTRRRRWSPRAARCATPVAVEPAAVAHQPRPLIVRAGAGPRLAAGRVRPGRAGRVRPALGRRATCARPVGVDQARRPSACRTTAVRTSAGAERRRAMAGRGGCRGSSGQKKRAEAREDAGRQPGAGWVPSLRALPRNRGPTSAVALRTLAPALLEAVEEPRLACCRVRRLAVPPTACRSGACALAAGLHRERSRAEHDDEAGHAEQRSLLLTVP